MLSKKAKYALKALKVLAEEVDGAPIQTSVIAERGNIPKKFLELILVDLRNGGLVQSHKGQSGGFKLRVAAREITFAKVLRIFDGPIAPSLCVSMHFYGKCDDCLDEDRCRLRTVLTEWRDANLEVLNRTTIADILESRDAAEEIHLLNRRIT
jgi:Rrf2 family protein